MHACGNQIIALSPVAPDKDAWSYRGEDHARHDCLRARNEYNGAAKARVPSSVFVDPESAK